MEQVNNSNIYSRYTSTLLTFENVLCITVMLEPPDYAKMSSLLFQKSNVVDYRRLQNGKRRNGINIQTVKYNYIYKEQLLELMSFFLNKPKPTTGVIFGTRDISFSEGCDSEKRERQG